MKLALAICLLFAAGFLLPCCSSHETILQHYDEFNLPIPNTSGSGAQTM